MKDFFLKLDILHIKSMVTKYWQRESQTCYCLAQKEPLFALYESRRPIYGNMGFFEYWTEIWVPKKLSQMLILQLEVSQLDQLT